MTAALEGGEWSAARSGRTVPSGKTRYPFYRRLGGPQGRSGRTENLVLTGIRSRTFQPVFSTIPTELPGDFMGVKAETRSSLLWSKRRLPINKRGVGWNKKKVSVPNQASHHKQVVHVRNVMAHAQKPDLVFQQNGRVHLNRGGGRFSRLLAVEECGSADRPCSGVQCKAAGYPLHSHLPPSLPPSASPCAIRFRAAYTTLQASAT